MTQVKVPPSLSARDKSSFAYKTIKDRLPVILVKTIDFLHRQRRELHRFGGTIEAPTEEQLTEIENDAKTFIGHLAKLRKDLETNKPAECLEPLELEPEFEHFNDDINLWNEALKANPLDDSPMPRWFESPWLLVECYLYRKVKEAALKTKHLKLFDPFVEQKQATCKAAINQMVVIAKHLEGVEKTIAESSERMHPSERTEFNLFIQLALWANKFDLSLSNMSADSIQTGKFGQDAHNFVDSLRENILCDHLSEVWFKFQSIKSQVQERARRKESDAPTEPIYIDLVADNSGYEIYVDICLVHCLTMMLCGTEASELVKFRIHLKRMPWFVSDTIRQDIDWLLNFMSTPDQDASLQWASKRWRSLFDSNTWIIQDHKFWTLPHDFASMQTVCPDLYSDLSKSSLIIFKGDLNYRKLVGDRGWHILTPFRSALRGFLPAPLVTLRTAKADVVVGIEDINIYSRITNNELPRDWMLTGDFALVQFVDPL